MTYAAQVSPYRSYNKPAILYSTGGAPYAVRNAPPGPLRTIQTALPGSLLPVPGFKYTELLKDVTPRLDVHAIDGNPANYAGHTITLNQAVSAVAIAQRIYTFLNDAAVPTATQIQLFGLATAPAIATKMRQVLVADGWAWTPAENGDPAGFALFQPRPGYIGFRVVDVDAGLGGQLTLNGDNLATNTGVFYAYLFAQTPAMFGKNFAAVRSLYVTTRLVGVAG